MRASNSSHNYNYVNSPAVLQKILSFTFLLFVDFKFLLFLLFGQGYQTSWRSLRCRADLKALFGNKKTFSNLYPYFFIGKCARQISEKIFIIFN